MEEMKVGVAQSESREKLQMEEMIMGVAQCGWR